MKNVPGGHNLFVQDKEVATLIENLYSVCISNLYSFSIFPVCLQDFLKKVWFNFLSIEIEIDVAEER